MLLALHPLGIREGEGLAFDSIAIADPVRWLRAFPCPVMRMASLPRRWGLEHAGPEMLLCISHEILA
jgi:hypothetical protein